MMILPRCDASGCSSCNVNSEQSSSDRDVPPGCIDLRKNGGQEHTMSPRIAYWGSTAVVALMLLTSLSYLTGSEQVVSGFAKAGYPQHLRIVLGLAKPVAAVVLLLPGLALLKEWAYAGVTFAWVMACISANASGEPLQIQIMPLILLTLLGISYATRPANRRLTHHTFPSATSPSMETTR
jgi:hypothetical protein